MWFFPMGIYTRCSCSFHNMVIVEKPEAANYGNNLASFRFSVSCRGKSIYVPTLLVLWFCFVFNKKGPGLCWCLCKVEVLWQSSFSQTVGFEILAHFKCKCSSFARQMHLGSWAATALWRQGSDGRRAALGGEKSWEQASSHWWHWCLNPAMEVPCSASESRLSELWAQFST